MYRAIFACNSRAGPGSQCVRALSFFVLALISQTCFCIELVSTNALGQQGMDTGYPRPSAISNDGETILFYSSDVSLVLPTPVRANYYVKNMRTGSIVEVIKRADGAPLQFGAGGDYFAFMDEPPTRVVFKTAERNLVPNTSSSDGRYRIFTTAIGSYQYFPARGLANDPNYFDFQDFTLNSQLDRLYVRTDQVLEISPSLPTPPIVHSVRLDGQPSQFAQGIEARHWPTVSVSGNGRILTWWGSYFDIDPNIPPAMGAQIFIRDTQLGTTRQVRADNGQNLQGTEFPHVSDDGSFVIFTAASYVTGPCYDYSIYGIDTRTRALECISVNDAGQAADQLSEHSSISADGNRVVFSSYARNLGPFLPSALLELGVYVRDRRLKRTVRVDINALGIPSNGRGWNGDPFNVPTPREAYPRISKNGRWVVFTSDASNLIPNDVNGHGMDVYRVDLNRFLPDPSLGAAPLVPVPSLSMLASLVLILGMLGFGVWIGRKS